MIVDNFKPAKSGFLASEKDMEIIANRIMNNKRIQRLLYYTTPDALNKPNLTDEQVAELFGKNIKIVPKLSVDGSVLNYIIISFDDFMIGKNPEFRDNIVEFDIICHFDQWQLQDFGLRPYKIAGELDAILKDTKLTGIGQLLFKGATEILLTDEFAGLCLIYQAWHGTEDEKKMPNPADEPQFQQDWLDYITAEKEDKQ